MYVHRHTQAKPASTSSHYYVLFLVVYIEEKYNDEIFDLQISKFAVNQVFISHFSPHKGIYDY